MEQAVDVLNKVSHTEVINYLIKKHKYKSYLEIGVGDPRENFCEINCEYKVGVDPYFDFIDVPNYGEGVAEIINECVKYRLTSDEFFKNLREDVKFDIIFIDGYHTEEQCDRDIQNSLQHLSNGGTIVVHDTCPYNEEFASDRTEDTKGFTWNGDVYKSIAKLRGMRIPYITLGYDYGITVIQLPPNCVVLYESDVPKIDIPYSDFNKYRGYFLNMVSKEEFLSKI